MAHFDEKSNTIILSEDDQEVLREAGKNVMNKTTPVANSIMRRILPKELRTNEE